MRQNILTACAVVLVALAGMFLGSYLAGPVPGPLPPAPTPVPPEPKPPTPKPDTVPVKDMSVLVVYESRDLAKLPKEQLSVLYAKSVRDYLQARCVKEADGWSSYRIYDQNVDTGGERELWKQLMTRPRQGVPWLVVHGAAGVAFEGPLPVTVDETMKLLRHYAEGK